jgi:hypothetical protein
MTHEEAMRVTEDLVSAGTVDKLKAVSPRDSLPADVPAPTRPVLLTRDMASHEKE